MSTARLGMQGKRRENPVADCPILYRLSSCPDIPVGRGRVSAVLLLLLLLL